ncbi:hypothetical protein [Paenibacillus radicis (ex Xue et al. 2023)]|uniref:Uncharacterized protein n=1 Tax=Paenibacillus radicis (ex Xue et al. 2023) TaxID=2972489 RepID=A0ABT1YFK0_9BACL|nr:hypothetical protein [Paenibacillus radicis (ex Xue et al. 2023)]MCR8631982.1 hypothetical protein [Paenibacillus radicis (ex Xue et al. 2023)]
MGWRPDLSTPLLNRRDTRPKKEAFNIEDKSPKKELQEDVRSNSNNHFITGWEGYLRLKQIFFWSYTEGDNKIYLDKKDREIDPFLNK